MTSDWDPPATLGWKISKLARFARMYGVRRTLYKANGRLRMDLGAPFWPTGETKQRTVGVLGCGQFAFATIGYFLSGMRQGGIAASYDVNEEAARSFAKFYCVPKIGRSAAEVIDDPTVKIVYIASNHASHAPYAVEALKRGLSVYCEKPVAVSLAQLAELKKAAACDGAKIYAGYNRPFAAAIQMLREAMKRKTSPLTLSCFISGHALPADHWYRRAGEGTRICGNVGHWLDLAVHMLSWGSLPDQWRIQLTWSNPQFRDENIAIAMTSSRGDLITIVMTARTEPFEGINETINVQQGDVIAKIDDFRTITIWDGPRLIRRDYRPKDVGHKAAILQPFTGQTRDWSEVELSSLLMLHIMHMVQEGRPSSEFSFAGAIRMLDEPGDSFPFKSGERRSDSGCLKRPFENVTGRE